MRRRRPRHPRRRAETVRSAALEDRQCSKKLAESPYGPNIGPRAIAARSSWSWSCRMGSSTRGAAIAPFAGARALLLHPCHWLACASSKGPSASRSTSSTLSRPSTIFVRIAAFTRIINVGRTRSSMGTTLAALRVSIHSTFRMFPPMMASTIQQIGIQAMGNSGLETIGCPASRPSSRRAP